MSEVVKTVDELNDIVKRVKHIQLCAIDTETCGLKDKELIRGFPLISVVLSHFKTNGQPC